MTTLDSSEAFEHLLANDIEPELPPKVRQVMLDLILAWANLDTAIGLLCTKEFKLDPTVGAILLGGPSSKVSDRLAKLRALQVQLGETEAAASIRRLKDNYEKRSKIRNRIAHAKCIGVRKSDPEAIIFLPWEPEGGFGNLAIEIHHLPELVRCSRWAIEISQRIDSFTKSADRTDASI